jgi:transposase-like protein
MKLTAKQKNKYVACPNHCPYCGSNDIEANAPEVDGPHAWADVTCNDCGKEWQDVYTLTHVDEKP